MLFRSGSGTSFVRLVAGFRSRNRLLGRGIAFRVQRTGVVQLRYYVRLLLLKREPEEIKEARSNLLRASFMLSVRCFFCSIIFPFADEERFPRGGIEGTEYVIWVRNGCGRRRKTGWTFGYSATCVGFSLEAVFVYTGFVSGAETLFCFGRPLSWMRSEPSLFQYALFGREGGHVQSAIPKHLNRRSEWR